MTNELMHGIFAASLCSTWLAVLLIMSRKWVAKYIGSKWNYYTWFSVFIPWVMVWIPLYFLTIPTVIILRKLTKPLLSPLLVYNPVVAKIFFTLTNGFAHSFILLKLFFIIWIFGTILCISYIVFRHIQFVIVLKKNARSLTSEEILLIRESLTQCQYKYIPRIYLSTSVVSPMVCHIFNTKIYLPATFFVDYTMAEQKYVLQHEFFHYQRGDLLANSFILLLSCINWFNPVMFFVYRYFRNAQELSCDAMVSKRFTAAEKKAYGYALVKTVLNQSSENPSVSCWWNTGIELKERCQMLKYNHSKPIKALLGLCIVISIVMTTVAVVSLENPDAFLFYSTMSVHGSDFVIKIFNNTQLSHPLHYVITSQKQPPVEGEIRKGDDEGEFITINGFLGEKANADIIVDVDGKMLWQGSVVFSEQHNNFNINFDKLDSHYVLSANAFSKIHAISFDIRAR